MTQRITIPDILPTHEKAIEKFLLWRDHPSKMLGGLVPLDLFKGQMSLDIDRVWFFGSCVWTPAVLGKKFEARGTVHTTAIESDIDIVFYAKDPAIEFAERVVAMLNSSPFQRLPFSIVMDENRWGGPKIKNTNREGRTQVIMDVTWLPPHCSIAEFISGFERDHERCAMMAGVRTADVGALTRIVRPLKHHQHLSEHRARCFECAKSWAKKEADRVADRDRNAERRADDYYDMS